MKHLHHFFLLATGLLAIGCANYDTRLNDSGTRYLGMDGSIITKKDALNHAESVSYWDGDGVSGNPYIVINLTGQTATFYKGNRVVGVSAISSGREGFATPTGNFKVTQKNKDHRSNLYGDYVDAHGNVVMQNVDVRRDPVPPGAKFSGAPMPYFMRIHGGVGTHAGFLPGVPDSHGCIRMPEKMARIFFENTPMHTPVRVTH